MQTPPKTLTGFRDTDEVLTSKMGDRELLELCKTANFSFCTDENFWRRRTFSRFGQIEKMEGKKWKEFYLQLVYYLDKYEDRNVAMKRAAKSGHEDVVMYIVSDKVEDLDWEQGLQGAAAGGNQKLVDFFIEKGANDWDAALGYAILGGYPKLVKFFLKQGAEMDDDEVSFKAGLSGNEEIVKILMDNQVDDWYQILVGAVEGGHERLIDLAIRKFKKKNRTLFLLNKDFNYDYVDTKKDIEWDELMAAAARGGHFNLVKKFIKEGADDWDRGLRGAAQGGNLDIFLFFVGKKAKDFAGALKAAVHGDKIEMIRYILENYPLKKKAIKEAKRFIKEDNKEIKKLLKTKLKQLKNL